MEINGTQVVAERGNKRRIRNIGKVKPEHLKLRGHKLLKEMNTEEEEWFEMVNIPSHRDEVQEEFVDLTQEEQKMEENIPPNEEEIESPP